jgi:hypothetical protein
MFFDTAALERQILAMTLQNHLNTTSTIVPDWNWTAFKKKGSEVKIMDLYTYHLLS